MARTRSGAELSRRSALVAAAATGAALIGAPRAAHAVPLLPRRFHWGVATSGYQSEGSAPDSNWSRYDDALEPYGDSVDFRHRYPEDIRNAAAMGVNTFRFGVEWARLEPAEGAVDPSAIAYYDDVVRRVRAAGMTPMITLDLWVHPGWIADRGGWPHEGTPQGWLANARRVVERYRGLGALWITFNEPTIYLQHEARRRPMTPVETELMRQRVVATHRAAYELIHELDPGALVSSNMAYIPAAQRVTDAAFLDHWADTLDFVGLDYYYGASLDNPTAVHAAADEFWKVDPQPEGLLYALRYYARRFPDLPLYVVENGMPTDNGLPRPDGYTRSDHLRDHIFYLQQAVVEGIDVIGYNYWSITDNYEWGSYRPRFGLYTVDVLTDPTLTRRPTDAVAAYRRIIRDGGVPAGYTPVKAPGFCAPDDLPGSCLPQLP